MAGETKLWEQVKHLLTPLRLPDLDPEKLKSVTAAEEVELRRMQVYAKVAFRVLTIISVFGGVSVLPFMGVDIRLFSAIGGAAVLVLISVTFWYCLTRNTLVSLPEPEDVKQNRDEQRGDKEQAIHGPQQ